MTAFQRIKQILFALLMILSAVIFIILPAEISLVAIISILAAGLAISGIKDIVFYFTMARHMVGGKLILFQGAVILDFALFTMSLSNVPKIYILLYLVGIHAFSGVVEILRANEARKTVEGPWKLKFSHGIINILLAALCVVFIKHLGIAVLIYSGCLVYSAVIRIINACRKTAFILIE